MKRTPDQSIAHAVAQRILRGGDDRLWTYADFRGMGRAAVAAALSRLTRAGKLARVRRGVYYRPRTTMFGLSMPDPEALADAILLARGEMPVGGGSDSFNRLGLTTQTSAVVTRPTRRRAGRTSLGNSELLTSTRPLQAQRGIRAEERTALDALRNISRIPDARPAQVLVRLKMMIESGALRFDRLARYARAEPPRVQALLGALGDQLRQTTPTRRVSTADLEALHKRLNPLTTYAIPGAREIVPLAASRWRIR